MIGLMTGFSASFLFLATVTLDFSPVIFVVLTVVFCTVMEMTCFLPLASVMVTLAFPAFKPFIVPLLFTETIFLLLEVQLLTESPFASLETFIFGSRLFYFQLNAGSRYLDRRCQFFCRRSSFPCGPCCWYASVQPVKIPWLQRSFSMVRTPPVLL